MTEDEAARRFGWARKGTAIQAALARVVEDLADDGRVKRDADGHLHA